MFLSAVSQLKHLGKNFILHLVFVSFLADTVACKVRHRKNICSFKTSTNFCSACMFNCIGRCS